MQRGSLYDRWAAWYPLLDPVEQHADECAAWRAAFDARLGTGPARLLELGGGAGHNAHFLADRFEVTVADLSPAMLALSRATNPGCRHVVADMRSLRLDEHFDAVLIHDAICHMTCREDLAAALRTAFVHLRPGGVALFVPDCVAESFVESTDDDACTRGERSLQYVVRAWDPDPADERTRTDYALLLRGPDGVHAVHMQHDEGLFSIETWRTLIEGAGFRVEQLPRPLPADEADGPYWDRLWRAQRPP